MPIPVPNGVDIKLEDGAITVKGPKGTLTKNIRSEMIVKIENNTVTVERPNDEGFNRSLHGLTRTIIANMVQGVTAGYEKLLQVHGVGYRAQMNGNNLNLQVGYSHPVDITPREGIAFEVGQEANTRTPLIWVRGIDKEVVGQQAAEVRMVRKPEPYKGKGIRYANEVVRRKVGKKAGGKK
jgi:large subunit ribosomal protein L6